MTLQAPGRSAENPLQDVEDGHDDDDDHQRVPSDDDIDDDGRQAHEPELDESLERRGQFLVDHGHVAVESVEQATRRLDVK